MRFNLLGPLEVEQHGAAVPITGYSQRATLAFLLLHANEAVAVSRLTKALWEDRPPPTTAKKVLQNAVAGLRGVLIRGGESRAATLLTHAPGYRLQLDPGQIDVTRFDRLVEHGRAELTAGLYERAAESLREALALWRGPALADLAEEGVHWPELTTMRNTHKAVLEDRMTAELALGRHHEVVAELESALGLDPVRERLCSLLMLALYRCGRQAEALDVYRRTRSALVEVGLDPGRRLRELEQAILDHDPVLDVPVQGSWGEPITLLPRSTPGRTVLRPVAVLAVRPPSWPDPEDAHAASITVESATRTEVERHGGLVSATLGSRYLAIFAGESAPDDAVRAALAIRGGLTDAGFAVTSGRVLMTTGGRTHGTPVDTAVDLVAAAGPGEVRVDNGVRRFLRCRFSFHGNDSGWALAEERPVPAPEQTPFVEREPELAQLRDLLTRVRLEHQPRRVHVLGAAGIGKTRLLAQFRQVAPNPVRFFVARARQFPHEGGSALAAGLAGVASAGDPGKAAITRLTSAAQTGPVVVVLEDIHHDGEAAAEFVTRLTSAAADLPLLVVTSGRTGLPVPTITVDPLSEKGITRLLGPSAPRWPVAWFGGNPFFAVEFAREPDPSALPLGVLLSVAARLDGLPASDRNALEHVALAAEPASASGFSGPDVSSRLNRLVVQGFLRLTGASGVADVHYAFREPVVREVTAALAVRSGNRSLHRRS